MKNKKTRSAKDGQRFATYLDYSQVSGGPEKALRRILPKHSGRNVSGRVTTRHQGGRQKRFLRKIDFKRSKRDIPGKVVSLEYDPNRTAHIALIFYADGERRYILAPQGLKVGGKNGRSEVSTRERVSKNELTCLVEQS